MATTCFEWEFLVLNFRDETKTEETEERLKKQKKREMKVQQY